MKFRLRLWLLSLTLIVAILSGCSLTKEPPKVGTVTLTDQVDSSTKAAKTALTGFPKGTRLMYVSVQVLNPRKGTKVEVHWFYDKDSNGQYNRVDAADVTFDTASRDRYAAFSLEAANPPFPPGAYSVQVFLDGQQVRELKFKVEP
ncbi:MAG TPA: hypothetical protein VGK74_29210 [Symbiobacteriaceae bacterium]